MTGKIRRLFAGSLCAVAVTLLCAPQAAAQGLPDVLVQAETDGEGLTEIAPASIERLLVIDAQSGMVVARKGDEAAFTPTGGAVTLMSAYIALNAGEAQVTVQGTEEAFALAAGLEAGCTYRTEDLVSAMLMTGAQDCAMALALQIAGSQEAFVAKMNETAAQLGMRNTVYVNCTGEYDQDQVTTMEDIGRLAYAVYGLGRMDVFAHETLRLEAVSGGQARAAELTNRVTLMQTEHETYDERVQAGLGSGGSEAGVNTVLLGRAGAQQVLLIAASQRSERRVYTEVSAMLDKLQGQYVTHDLSAAAQQLLQAQLDVPQNVHVSWQEIEAAVTTASDAEPDMEKLRCDVQLTDAQMQEGAVYALAQIRYGDAVLDEIEVMVTAVEQAQEPVEPTPKPTPAPTPTPEPDRVETVIPDGYEPYQRSLYDRFGWIAWSLAAVLGGLALWFVPMMWEKRRR